MVAASSVFIAKHELPGAPPTYVCRQTTYLLQIPYALSYFLSLSLFVSFRFFLRENHNEYLDTMKLCGLLAASVAAASATAAISVSSSLRISHQDGLVRRGHDESSSVRSSSANKFAPRFDGLRFIETLVTAHR